MGDVYIDPTKLKALPRTIVPDVVAPSNMPAPFPFPALPWFIGLVAIQAMPLSFSVMTFMEYGHQTCDRNAAMYLQGQGVCSICYVIFVGIPMWKRIQWVGALKDAIAESPELATYTTATTLWWFEFGWSMFGLQVAVEASACSTGLKYASETLSAYMFGLGIWLDLLFHIVVPSLMHLYSGQPGADILPPGATYVDPTDSLPKAPPKRKRPPPKRECPRCRHDAIPEELKMCPVCGAFVPPLEVFIKIDKEEQEKEKKRQEDKAKQ